MKQPSIEVGDYVLIRQKKQNKLSTAFDTKPVQVTDIRGPAITVHRDSKFVIRNVADVKKIPHYIPGDGDPWFSYLYTETTSCFHKTLVLSLVFSTFGLLSTIFWGFVEHVFGFSFFFLEKKKKKEAYSVPPFHVAYDILF